ncbi:MAG: rod shape-determining protein MreC, partial [Cyanobacteria bacterium REEB65]|nr:rod shape-determining protein MreC [Cyanobacteria bacterium REEB65]
MGSVVGRLPLREVGFGLGLILLAGISGWLSGQSMLLPEIFRPGLSLVETTWTAVRGGAGYLQDVNRLRQENVRLQREVDDLEARASRQAEMASEVGRLRALLGMQATMPEHGRFARVIGRSPDNWHARLYLDKGSADGIQVDAVAMAPQGVVGRVIRVGANTAEVALLTDPGNEVSCLDQRSRSPGVVA